MKYKTYSASIVALVILAITSTELMGVSFPAPFAVLGLALVGAAALGGLSAGLIGSILAATFFLVTEFNEGMLTIFDIENINEGVVKVLAYLIVGPGIGLFSQRLQDSSAKSTESSDRLVKQVSFLDSQIRAIVLHSPAVMYLQDVTGAIALVNKKFEHCYGRSQDDVKGMYPDTIFSPALAKSVSDQHGEVKRTLEAVEVEYEIDFIDGTSHTVSATKFPVLDNDGNLLGVGTIESDISAREQIQSELRDHGKRLDQAQRLANFGSWSQDVVSGERYWSENIYRILGYEPYSITLDQQKIAEAILPEDREKALAGFAQIMAGNFPDTEMEYRIQRPDETIRYLRARAEVNFDINKNPVRVLGTVHDVTEQVTSEKKRRELERQLTEAQKNELIATLIGGIAHNFNNILTPVLGYVDMAKFEVAENKSLAEDLEVVAKGIDEARDLMHQLLLFTGNADSPFGRMEIQQVVAESLRLTKSWISSRIRIDSDIESVDADIWGDKSQIIHLIINLCINAAQAMEENVGAIRIELKQGGFDEDVVKLCHEDQGPNYICISVSDTGKGIDRDEIGMIFEPFYSNTGKKNSGLGLSVAQGIVNAHGGKISVESELGRGSTFHAFLPVMQTTEQEKEEIQQKSQHRASGYVLLVDDEEANLNMFTKMLKSMGYSVSACINGEQALDKLRKFPDRYDLLVTDVRMPKMSGIELAEKAQAGQSSIPVVLMTGYLQDLDAASQELGNIQEIMQKPVKLATLAPVIKRAIEQRDSV